MKVNFEYTDALNGVIEEVLKSEKILESEQVKFMAAVGKEIKKQVVNVLPKSDRSGGDYKHMREDIKISRSGIKSGIGITGVTIHGGKNTGYKWHMLDDGTRNPDGSVHTRATHFTEKAMTAAEPAIERLMNDMERRIAES